MTQKFLISKICSNNFNRDTIEVLIFLSKEYPQLEKINIKSESGKVKIYNSSICIILPDYKVTTKGIVEFMHEYELVYISFIEIKN